MRAWYAIQYAYGRGAVNHDGNRADHIHWFATKGARDAFVDTQERSGSDADPLPAAHPLVRRALRYQAQGLDWPIAVVGE